MRTLLALATLAVAACAGGGPAVSFPSETPDDFRELAEEVVAGVVAALPEREECLDGLRIEAARELDDRAGYVSAEGRVIVRIPATAPQLTVSLVHEIGHHLDHVCGDDALRSAFLTAEGRPLAAPWDEAASWEETPAEQFAEAIVRVVTGRPDNLRRVPVTDAAAAVVAAWGGGEDLSHGTGAP